MLQHPLIVKCPIASCNKNLKYTTVKKAYSNKLLTMAGCDGCQATLTEKDYIYHCDISDAVPHHQLGYDLCPFCVECSLIYTPNHKKSINTENHSIRRHAKKRPRKKVTQKEEEAFEFAKKKNPKDIKNANDICNTGNQNALDKQKPNVATQNSNVNTTPTTTTTTFTTNNIANANTIESITITPTIANVSTTNGSYYRTKLEMLKPSNPIKIASFTTKSANHISAIISHNDTLVKSRQSITEATPSINTNKMDNRKINYDSELGWDQMISPSKKRRLNDNIGVAEILANQNCNIDNNAIIMNLSSNKMKSIEDRYVHENSGYSKYDIDPKKLDKSKKEKKLNEIEDRAVNKWDEFSPDDNWVEWDVRQLLQPEYKINGNTLGLIKIPLLSANLAIKPKKNVLQIFNAFKVQMQQDWINLARDYQNPCSNYWKKQSRKKRLAIEEQILAKEEQEIKQARQFFGEEYIRKYKNKNTSDIIAKHQQIIVLRNLQFKKHVYMILKLKLDALGQAYEKKRKECMNSKTEESLKNKSKKIENDIMSAYFNKSRKELKKIKKQWRIVRAMPNELSVVSNSIAYNAIYFHQKAIITASNFLRREEDSPLCNFSTTMKQFAI